MNKVISFSLWGNKECYRDGAYENVLLAKYLYPDWRCRFYLDDSVCFLTKKTLLKNSNVEIIEIDEETKKWSGMFWRFLAAEDADIAIFRDCDSRLSERELLAVNDWISGTKSFHIMRDHPQHSTQVMGGMWGVQNRKFAHIRALIRAYYAGEMKDYGYGIDQNWLKEMWAPYIQHDCIVHDEFFDKKPFPSSFRRDDYFVGRQHTDDG